MPICLFSLIIFQNNCYALSFKISRSVGESRGQYGKNSSLDGVERLQRSYTSFSVEKGWKKWFGSSSFSNNDYSESNSAQSESVMDIKFGRSFGNKSNQLGLFFGLSQNNLYIPLNTDFEEASFLGKGAGIRVTSSFLTYEFFSQASGSLEVGGLSTTSKEISHKVSLNLGEKFKYGLYYFSKTQDFSGELSYYRNSQGLGIYVGYKL
ncbi:hypothetical protein OAT67_07840 [Bacteriovoracaceae bacterium]|nr:hypothetical protein [Bacteriovoracaceae bacterium]